MPEPVVVAGAGVVDLMLIAVPAHNQGKGYATRALQMLTALCDDNGITITLIARQMDQASLSHYAPGCPATLSTAQLIAWYGKHGFIKTAPSGDHTPTMVREPRSPTL